MSDQAHNGVSGLEYDTDASIGEPVDPTPAPWPSRTTLKGRVVSMIPLDPDAHTKDLYDTISGPGRERLWHYLPDGPFPDAVKFHEFVVQRSQSKDPMFFVIIDNQLDKAVGICSYLSITPQSKSIEVGYITYSPLLQRTVGATEAMYLMARHAFEDLGYRRYEWKCDALNKPSQRAALRLGFQFEGVFRNHTIYKGRNRDTAWFSIIDKEWPLRKKAFETWLNPNNFDESGAQRVSLSTINEELNKSSDNSI